MVWDCSSETHLPLFCRLCCKKATNWRGAFHIECLPNTSSIFKLQSPFFNFTAVGFRRLIFCQKEARRRCRARTLSAACNPCLIGMRPCANVHNWVERLLRLVMKVRLIPRGLRKPIVKRRRENGRLPGPAEAKSARQLQRPNMRFCPGYRSATKTGCCRTAPSRRIC